MPTALFHQRTEPHTATQLDASLTGHITWPLRPTAGRSAEALDACKMCQGTPGWPAGARVLRRCPRVVSWGESTHGHGGHGDSHLLL